MGPRQRARAGLIPGGGLERVREGVTEVELRTLSLLARIAQADRRP